MNLKSINLSDKATDQLCSRVKHHDAHVAILGLGLAYKKNVEDTRESPSFKIIDILMKKSAYVQYSDPYLPVAPKTRMKKDNIYTA